MCFCFPHIFRTTEESVLGPSEDCLCCQLLEWKLHVDLTLKQVHSGSTYFRTVIQCCWSIGRVYSGSLKSETFRVTSVSACYLSLLATKMNSTNVESERYSDYFNPMSDISNNNFSKKLACVAGGISRASATKKLKGTLG